MDRDTNGNPRFGLIGDPISSSLSPALFHAAYGGRYAYDLIQGADFETSYSRFLTGYAGINVTAPFKEDAFRKADTHDSICRKIGATNLLIKTDGGIMAHNSDYLGIAMSLAEAAIKAKGGSSLPDYSDMESMGSVLSEYFGRRPSALIVGCGGAGKAAAVAAGDLGLDTTLINRSEDKAARIAASLPEYGFRTAPVYLFEEMLLASDIIIYTVPGRLSITGGTESGSHASPFQGDGGTSRKLILEANYKTPVFPGSLMERLPGSVYISGKRWLLHQAAGGYMLFTGEDPDFRSMERELASDHARQVRH